RCPLAFRFKYVDGARLPTRPSLFPGQMVHKLLQNFYGHRQLAITLEAAALSERLEAVWGQAVENENVAFDSLAQEQLLKTQTVDLVTAYLAQLPHEEPPSIAVEAVMEAPLLDPVSGEDLAVPLVGITDLVIEGREGPVIIDFKTAARSAAPLEISHEIQLTSYAYLFRHVFGKPESALEIRSLIKTKVPQVQHQVGIRILVGPEANVVQGEKHVHRPDPLVSVDQRMVLHNMEQVGCRHFAQVRMDILAAKSGGRHGQRPLQHGPPIERQHGSKSSPNR
ncbi:unnamed protein product, partial [marine sediment metagenome]